jgi:hypothetical protein
MSRLAEDLIARIDCAKLAWRLSVEESRYAQMDLLEKAVAPLGDVPPSALLWHLLQQGTLDFRACNGAVKESLLSNVADSAAGGHLVAEAKEVAFFLTLFDEPKLPSAFHDLTADDYASLEGDRLPPDDAADEGDDGLDYAMFFPGWPDHLDQIVASLGVQDLLALATSEGLAPWQRDGVTAALRRHGVASGEFRCNIAARIAFAFLHQGFAPKVELFTRRDTVARSLLFFALRTRHLPRFRPFDDLLPALEIAGPAQRREVMRRHGKDDLDMLRFCTLAELEAWAEPRGEDDWFARRCDLPALLMAGRQGLPMPEAILDRVLTTSWRLESYPQLSNDPSTWNTAKGLGIVRIGAYVELLRYLPKERAKSAVLWRSSGGSAAALVAGAPDQEVFDRTVKALVAKEAPGQTLFPHGAALLGGAALAPLMAAYDTLQPENVVAELEIRMAILYCLSQEHEWEERHDRCLQFHGWGDQWKSPMLGGYSHVEGFVRQQILPVLEHVIAKLPAARKEAVLVRALENPVPARVPAFARCLPLLAAVPRLLERAAHCLVACESKLETPAIREYLDRMSKGLSQEQREGMLLAAFALPGARSEELWSTFASRDRYEALTASSGRRAVPTEKDGVDKLLDMLGAKDWSGKKAQIALLREKEGTDDTFNQRHGVPRGVTEATWPIFAEKDEPMQFLLMLDLKTIPALKPMFPDARAVALFISSAEHAHLRHPRNDHARIVPLSEEDMKHEPLAQPPADPVEVAGGFDIIPASVPEAIFDDERYDGPGSTEDEGDQLATADNAVTLTDLRDALFQLHGRVLGSPSWLRDPEHWGDFVGQFDEMFLNVSLGAGTLYVFTDAVFSQ